MKKLVMIGVKRKGEKGFTITTVKDNEKTSNYSDIPVKMKSLHLPKS